MKHFADELTSAIHAKGNPLCVGLDPHFDLMPKLFRGSTESHAFSDKARIIENFLSEVIEIVRDKVAVVKPQSAFFEAVGSDGIATLERVVGLAGSVGLKIILDAKRNDIGSTAKAYADAFLVPGAACEVDAITINPYLGLDGIDPFLDCARLHGKGVFVLCKTSNKSSSDYQDLRVGSETIYERVADSLRNEVEELAGERTGWSSLGFVVGASHADEARKIRERVPRALFLVPGYGAQGGSAELASSSFTVKDGSFQGGIVNSSRSIIFPRVDVDVTFSEWRNAVEQALLISIREFEDCISRR